MVFQSVNTAYRKAGKRLFVREYSYRITGNGFKLKEERFILDAKRKIFFFTTRATRHWHMLPREFVVTPFLEVFKARALGNLV